jgi:hypothetical protein
MTGLWARIRGADKGLRRPSQPATALGALSDANIASPYGLWADLPDGALLREIGPGVFTSMTETRPTDTEQGEPVFFHPATNTRIVARNNGDLDISTTDGSGNVNIDTVTANITASSSVTIDSPQSTFTGAVQIDGPLNVNGDITGLANVIAGLLVQGATLTITTGGSIGGKDYLTHTHSQGTDSRGDTQAETNGVT